MGDFDKLVERLQNFIDDCKQHRYGQGSDVDLDALRDDFEEILDCYEDEDSP